MIFDVVKRVGVETWELTVEMAPYLLLGFFIAGVLSQFLKDELVARWLGGKGWRASVRASLVGIPLPLCSCGVVPVAAGLRKQGAARGPVASFLTSTPQTGVDSILANYALMGWAFTMARVIAAFVTGVVCGVAVDRTDEGEISAAEPKKPCCSQETASDSEEETSSCCGDEATPRGRFVEALRYGFVILPRNIGRSVLVGLVLAGVISAFVPADFFDRYIANELFAMIAVTAVAIPLYVCSTGSIPFAFAMMNAGLSPGAALVFLITGPATNAVTVSAVGQMLGKRAVLPYLATLVLCAWGAGFLFNLMSNVDVDPATHPHQNQAQAAFASVAAIGLLIVLFSATLHELFSKNETPGASID
jgi:uncharacterized membrane protein YraQ (UPF0718 family)